MKILITGGNGFIGTALTDHFLSQGAEVTVFDRATPQPELTAHFQQLPGRFQAHAGDIRDSDAVAAAFGSGPWDLVVHAAVITADRERERRDAKTIMDVNMMGTMTVLDILRHVPVTRAIYVSSASVYGEAAFDAGALDESANRPVPDSLYAISKYACERAWLRFDGLTQADLRTVRLGSAYGPFERRTGLRDTMSPPFQIMEAHLTGKPATMPRDALRDWIYTRDITGAIEKLATAGDPRHRVFNLGLGENLPISAFCRGLEAVTPAFSWSVETAADRATVNLHGDRDRSMLAVDRLTRDLGYTPSWTPERAAADYQSWQQANPGLRSIMFD